MITGGHSELSTSSTVIHNYSILLTSRWGCMLWYCSSTKRQIERWDVRVVTKWDISLSTASRRVNRPLSVLLCSWQEHYMLLLLQLMLLFVAYSAHTVWANREAGGRECFHISLSIVSGMSMWTFCWQGNHRLWTSRLLLLLSVVYIRCVANVNKWRGWEG